MRRKLRPHKLWPRLLLVLGLVAEGPWDPSQGLRGMVLIAVHSLRPSGPAVCWKALPTA